MINKGKLIPNAKISLDSKLVTYSWEDTGPLIDFDFIIIKGDSGTGTGLLAKRLQRQGYTIFFENILFNGTPESPEILRDLQNLSRSSGKIVYIGNGFKSKPGLQNLIKPSTKTLVISFALYPTVKIPVKEYLIVEN